MIEPGELNILWVSIEEITVIRFNSHHDMLNRTAASFTRCFSLLTICGRWRKIFLSNNLSHSLIIDMREREREREREKVVIGVNTLFWNFLSKEQVFILISNINILCSVFWVLILICYSGIPGEGGSFSPLVPTRCYPTVLQTGNRQPATAADIRSPCSMCLPELNTYLYAW